MAAQPNKPNELTHPSGFLLCSWEIHREHIAVHLIIFFVDAENDLVYSLAMFFEEPPRGPGGDVRSAVPWISSP
jgi:hypothetical protein